MRERDEGKDKVYTQNSHLAGTAKTLLHTYICTLHSAHTHNYTSNTLKYGCAPYKWIMTYNVRIIRSKTLIEMRFTYPHLTILCKLILFAVHAWHKRMALASFAANIIAPIRTQTQSTSCACFVSDELS